MTTANTECPTCGADMLEIARSAGFKCQYCGFQQPLKQQPLSDAEQSQTFARSTASTEGVGDHSPVLTSSTAVTHDRISFALAGGWTLSTNDGMLQGLLVGTPDAAMILWPTKDLGERSLSEAFVAAIEASTKGRSLLKSHPPEPGTGSSRSGVSFVAQSRVTQGPSGDVWMALYYVLDVGAGAFQLLSFIAGSSQSFTSLASAAGAGVEGVTVHAPAPAPSVTLGGTSGAASSIFQQTGIHSNQYVSGTFSAESNHLEPVPFSIGFVRHYGFLETPLIGRGRDGAVYAISPSKTFLWEGNTNLMRVPPAPAPLVNTRLGREQLDRMLREQRQGEGGAARLMVYDRIDVLSDGSVFFTMTVYDTHHNVFFALALEGG